MKVAQKRATLIQNCHGFSIIEPKFSSFMSSRVAAPSNPTTAGRSPLKTFCTGSVFMYFMNILLIRIMRMSDGSTKAKVAVADPRMAMGMP